jgi:hypothetical protein
MIPAAGSHYQAETLQHIRRPPHVSVQVGECERAFILQGIDEPDLGATELADFLGGSHFATKVMLPMLSSARAISSGSHRPFSIP